MPFVTRFGYESATAIVIDMEDGRYILSSVNSEDRGNGHATILLEIITEYADERGMDLKLVAVPCGDDPPMDSLQLKAFYERFDFVAFDESRTYYIEMERKAR
jgi:ribosomal protein S18 acetylase RimI-like enzyme